jgi:hypothetical protein
MNLLDLYEMRDPRDAYERDVANSQAGMGKQSRADVTGEEEPSGVFTVVINGRPWKTGSSNEMFALAGRIANKHTDKKVAVKWPTGELNTVRPQGMTEAQQLSVQQLATISDAALDKAYSYGRSQPGNSFGWQANLKSAAFAKQMIDKGVTDIEAISDAIHKGWNTTAQEFVQNPEQFDDTAKLKAAGKLEAKLQQRAQLMKQNYGQLPEEEKEKDRVVARALLQALKGEQGTVGSELNEGKADYNFDIEDLKRLETIRDLSTLKTQALALISKPSAKPMKPEKVEWFKNALERMNSPLKVIKLMYDLLLSGEGNAVVGSRSSMNPNSYRQRFSEQGDADSDGHSVDHADSGEYDYEGDQAKDQLNTIVRAARRLDGMLDDNENMPEWVQMKITNAADYIDTAADYIESNQEPELDEGEKVGNMDADAFDAAMARLKQLAGAGPLKTVYDPTKRVYRNVPVAVQPKK